MDDEERFERLLEVLDELVVENLETPIVVEGLKDVKALRILGCAGEIHPINAGHDLHTRAETLAGGAKQVILLTDWDRKGGELFVKMRAKFAANGVRADGEFRDKLQHWMRPPVKDVESLAGYVTRNLERYHGKDLGDR